MKQKIVILALLVAFAAGIAAFTLVYDRAVFDGSYIANSDSCRLDIARMTGSDRHTLAMNAGGYASSPKERILKEYIPGLTIAELLRTDRMESGWLEQVCAMCRLLYPAGWNIDYYPTNFIPYNGTLYYIDYECNPYMTEWDFAHWGAQYWTMQPPEG